MKRPQQDKFIPYSKVVIDAGEFELVKEVLESGWLTTAVKAQLFETRFAEAVSTQFACAVNSGTAALHLALEAMGVGPGDKVLVPTMTFTATAEVVRYLGADPVFVDVEYGSSLITPEILSEGLRRHRDVKVVMIVHYGGQAAEMTSPTGQGILDICREHGVRVIEDAAHAFPTMQNGRMVGGLGDATCFSFYANKTITTGEGGMLTTNDEEVFRRAKVMRLHGIDRDVWQRHTSRSSSWEYDVVAPGYKYNMPDINAAIGLAQLGRAYQFRAERARCARFYLENLGHLSSLDLPLVKGGFSEHAWHLFPIILKEGVRIERDRFIELMSEKGIGTSVHYKPLHRLSYYRDRYSLDAADFPEAERVWRGCVSLPIYPSLTEDELTYICAMIEDILGSS